MRREAVPDRHVVRAVGVVGDGLAPLIFAPSAGRWRAGERVRLGRSPRTRRPRRTAGTSTSSSASPVFRFASPKSANTQSTRSPDGEHLVLGRLGAPGEVDPVGPARESVGMVERPADQAAQLADEEPEVVLAHAHRRELRHRRATRSRRSRARWPPGTVLSARSCACSCSPRERRMLSSPVTYQVSLQDVLLRTLDAQGGRRRRECPRVASCGLRALCGRFRRHGAERRQCGSGAARHAHVDRLSSCEPPFPRRSRARRSAGDWLAGVRSPGFRAPRRAFPRALWRPQWQLRRLIARSQWRDRAGFSPDFPWPPAVCRGAVYPGMQRAARSVPRPSSGAARPPRASPSSSGSAPSARS